MTSTGSSIKTVENGNAGPHRTETLGSNTVFVPILTATPIGHRFTI
jgi:hypothetical protein